MKTFIIVLFISIFSCNSKENKKTEFEKLTNFKQQNLESITCYLISLDGSKEIYKIENNILYSFGKEKKIEKREIAMLSQIPELITKKDLKYGCGVCVDGIDFKFVFKFKDKIRKLEIQPGNDKIPNDLKSYTNLLIKKYDEQLIK